MLEHPQRNWLPTEGEKVAALEALGIPRRLFPCRYDSGSDSDRRCYFVLKLPLVIEDDMATFVYADPGQRTDTGLRALQRAGRQIRVLVLIRDASQAEHAAALRDLGRSPRVINPAGGRRPPAGRRTEPLTA